MKISEIPSDYELLHVDDCTLDDYFNAVESYVKLSTYENRMVYFAETLTGLIQLVCKCKRGNVKVPLKTAKCIQKCIEAMHCAAYGNIINNSVVSSDNAVNQIWQQYQIIFSDAYSISDAIKNCATIVSDILDPDIIMSYGGEQGTGMPNIIIRRCISGLIKFIVDYCYTEFGYVDTNLYMYNVIQACTYSIKEKTKKAEYVKKCNTNMRNPY